jgi:hypothetical protein
MRAAQTAHVAATFSPFPPSTAKPVITSTAQVNCPGSYLDRPPAYHFWMQFSWAFRVRVSQAARSELLRIRIRTEDNTARLVCFVGSPACHQCLQLR